MPTYRFSVLPGALVLGLVLLFATCARKTVASATDPAPPVPPRPAQPATDPRTDPQPDVVRPDKLPPETDVAPPGSAKARQMEARQQKAGLAAVFSLRKTPCYGECPVFRITVLSDGVVLYSGIRNVAPLGEYQARVTTDWVDRLLRKAVMRGVFGLSATYPEDTDLFIADVSNTITTVVWNGREKTITHNHDAPPALVELEDALTELIGELKWQPRPQDQ